MTVAEQFELALEFMLLGMGVVFAFLTFLVLVVKWMGMLVQKVECHSATTVDQSAGMVAHPVADSDETLAAVISAAVHQYRAPFPDKRD